MSESQRTRLYEKGWKYVKANDTDVAKTFARIKRQQAEQAKQSANVKPIRGAKG